MKKGRVSMENKNRKEGLYMVKVDKECTFTRSEGDVLTYTDTEVHHVLVQNFENFLIYLNGVNRDPDVIGVTYNKIDDSALIL